MNQPMSIIFGLLVLAMFNVPAFFVLQTASTDSELLLGFALIGFGFLFGYMIYALSSWDYTEEYGRQIEVEE